MPLRADKSSQKSLPIKCPLAPAPEIPDGELSPFKRFCRKWQAGCGALECTHASKIVLCKGKIPCDILFIGEAPGPSEDSLGEPFVGPAGQLLDAITVQVIPPGSTCPICGGPCRLTESGVTCPQGHGGVVSREEFRPSHRIAYTNMVACQPWDVYERRKAMEPSVDQIEQCVPRLEEFIILCKPRLIVTVGAIARDWLDPQGFRYTARADPNVMRVALVHPAAMLRMNQLQRDMQVRRSIIALRTAISEAFEGK